MTASEPAPDISRFTRLLFDEAGRAGVARPVFEVRIPKAGRDKVVSGYFDNVEAAAAAIAARDGTVEGIYITPNPVRPECFARAANKLKPYAEATTADDQVTKRLWFLVDIDPVRPRGVSSTDAQHAEAMVVADQVRAFLADHGWPEPIANDSGNGAHLLYRVEMQNDAATRDLVRRCLEALSARFDDDFIKIDTSVHNAARIWKVPGTWAKKGDDTPEQPHRRSAVIEAPDQLAAVPVALLSDLAGQKKKEQPRQTDSGSWDTWRDSLKSSEFDLRAWVDRHCAHLEPGEERDLGGGGWKRQFKKCPWEPDHANTAYVGQRADGAIIAGCLGARCQGKKWHDLRDALEPGRRDRPWSGSPTEHTDADAPPPDAGKWREMVDFTRPITEILIGVDEQRVADEAVAALARLGNIYHRGGELVSVAVDGDETRIRPVAIATLRERMAAAARWSKRDAEGNPKSAHPPEWAVRAIHARGEWPPLRRLVGVSRIPILRPDGTIASAQGYDAPTGMLCAPGAAFGNIPGVPTGRDVAEAVNVLLDPFCDFPWRAPSDRAAAISAILSIIGRTAIAGPVPLLAIRATTPGAGKGLLAEIIALAATGLPPTLITPPCDDAEWRKTIMSLARVGVPIVSLDNVEGPLGSGPLAAALTAAEISDRALGSTAMVTAPARAVWLATGNGITLRRDLGRRVILCDLAPATEHPEDRTGWRHQNLTEFVRGSWPGLVVAGLTLLRAYHVAGRPAHGAAPLGSFSAWDELVRGACVWSGIGDPDGARVRIREEGDDDRDALRSALAAWRAAYGTRPATTADACAKAEVHPELSAALAGIVRGQLTPRALGNAMRRLRGRLSGGVCFADGGMIDGNRRWRVAEGSGSQMRLEQEPLEEPLSLTDGDSGSSGSSGSLPDSVKKLQIGVGNAPSPAGQEPLVGQPLAAEEW